MLTPGMHLWKDQAQGLPRLTRRFARRPVCRKAVKRYDFVTQCASPKSAKAEDVAAELRERPDRAGSAKSDFWGATHGATRAGQLHNSLRRLVAPTRCADLSRRSLGEGGRFLPSKAAKIAALQGRFAPERRGRCPPWSAVLRTALDSTTTQKDHGKTVCNIRRFAQPSTVRTGGC
jgi:hypothetical protein